MRFWNWCRIRDLLEVKEERVKNRFTDQVEAPWHIYCGSLGNLLVPFPLQSYNIKQQFQAVEASEPLTFEKPLLQSPNCFKTHFRSNSCGIWSIVAFNSISFDGCGYMGFLWR
jgi:hypothetical protein